MTFEPLEASDVRKKPGPMPGSKHGLLNDPKFLSEVKRRLAAGETGQQIASALNVSEPTVSRARRALNVPPAAAGRPKGLKNRRRGVLSAAWIHHQLRQHQWRPDTRGNIGTCSCGLAIPAGSEGAELLHARHQIAVIGRELKNRVTDQ